jgi:hypothetical protein
MNDEDVGVCDAESWGCAWKGCRGKDLVGGLQAVLYIITCMRGKKERSCIQRRAADELLM